MVDNLPVPWDKHLSGDWASVASSGNGEILLAVEDRNDEPSDQIRVSTDAGLNWSVKPVSPDGFAEPAERTGHRLTGALTCRAGASSRGGELLIVSGHKTEDPWD